MNTQSYTYRLLKYLGLNFSEREYGNISIYKAFKRSIVGLKNALLLKYCMYSVLLSPLNYRLIRPKLWRMMGCNIGRKVFIGYDVWIDFTNTNLITIEDNVHIANKCILLCHQRNLNNYFIGDDYAVLPYKRKPILLKKGCLIGMGSIIMPGVCVGEGAIVGAGSVLIHDVPDWTIAAGNPARVIKRILPKQNASNHY
jgi:acetyltransferase-like isoleucine patch superfamily enzyme